MKNLILKVISQPQGKPRPRVTRRGTYTPKTQFADDCMKEFKGHEIHSEAYVIDVRAVFKRPKSHFKTGKKTSHLLTPRAPFFMTNVPDRDNIDKAVLDCLKKAGVIHEDAAVIGGHVTKEWGDNGFCEVSISAITRDDVDESLSVDDLPPFTENFEEQLPFN